jgi:hypothetical protein
MIFFDDYRKRKDTLETKKCKNCLRRISLHWNVCPWCKHSDYLFNEEYLYNEQRMVRKAAHNRSVYASGLSLPVMPDGRACRSVLNTSPE